ncbi:F-box LRR-repeat 6 [Chlorella sorokiniana]|uniref:F-box LRR-repeat 6 n=1 Tax=Chlorella sorokiniana TaxID=3076 RepID=A0A2P6TKI4_CHLSO|nr:F-box LRR-repeat 6 [Chlorella sorokiniana]|eukprot:PRW44604.1 F-box LRR-repeat 6 [Chlorella sorokiniana]
MERTASAGSSSGLEDISETWIDDLDCGGLLSRVLYLAGKPSWPAIALTCRHWRDLLFSEPQLWSTVRIETVQLDFLSRPRKEAWFRHKRALLQRMVPLITALAVHDRTGMLRSGAHGTAGAWGLPDLLGMLCPAVVADVELEVHPSPPVEALQALPRLAAGLTALNLDAQQLPPEAAAVLPQLSGLCSLRLAAQHLPEGGLPAILQLSLLSRLELESSFLPLPPMAPLTALRRLKQLWLVDDSERQDALLLPAPADFGAQGGLDSLAVYTRQTWQVADTTAGFLFLHCTAPDPDQPGQASPTAAASRCGKASLTLHGHSRQDARLDSLAALLEALLPASSAAPVALRVLHIGGFSRLSAEEVEGCPGLAAVQHLGLVRCGTGSTLEEGLLQAAEAALAALLTQMPTLQQLDLSGWPGSSLPSCVADCGAGLTQLVLAESGLTELPCSACPPGLVELDLHRCQTMTFTEADAEKLLDSCPRLRKVQLEGTMAAGGDVAALLAAALERRRTVEGQAA